MKKIIIILLLVSPVLKAQEWVRLMQDPYANFYDVKEAFNRNNDIQERRNNNFFNRLFKWSKPEEKESPGYEVYKRWEYFNEPRVYPSGNHLNPDLLWNEYQNYTKGNPDFASQTSGNWTSMGPTSWLATGWNPGIGRVNVVAVDPADSNIVYIGSPSGGLWKSTNGGTTWLQPTTDFLPSMGVSAIAIDYTNTSTIYIGTGDGDATDTYSTGVLKSTDGGLTWTQSGLTWSLNQSRSVCKLLIDPVDPNILFAATKDAIYKTTDGASHWTMVKSGSFRDMEFKPGNSQVIYAAGTSYFRSVDGGNTFGALSAGLPASTAVNRLAIAVTPADSNYVYIAAGNNANSGFYGLYKSTDGGTTFNVQSTSPNLYGFNKSGNDVGGQSWYSMTLCVSPVDREKIFTGGVNIWTSSNGGVNWTLNTHWNYPVNPQPYVHADQHCMEYFGSTLYVGCDGGVYKSENNGVSWSDKSAGLCISQFYCIGGAANNANLFMAGAQDNGCSIKNNNQWTHIIGADGMEVAIDPVNNFNVYAESQSGTIYGSTNGGVNMTHISTPVTEGGSWVTPYMLDPSDPTTIYAGYINVWRGDNGGTSWTKVSNFTGSTNISALKVSEANSNYIYIIRGASLYKSDDAGNNWTNISAGLPTGIAQLTYIAIHPADPGKLWVTFSGHSAGNKVFYSADTGQTWINESMNLPNIPVNCIAYQNGTADGLYIGTDMGVYYKDDNLSAWQPFWNGLPNVVITELEPNYVANKLRAGTYGRGAWESDFYTINAPPHAAFTSNHQYMCPGDSVKFTDQSLDAAPGWQWIFSGGTPATSNLQNPVVYYYAVGDYEVKLIVQNSLGVDTATKTLYIHVSNPGIASLPLMQDFEGGSFPPAGWNVIDPDNAITWQEAAVGGFGNSLHSAVVPNFGVNVKGEKDLLLTPAVDLSQLVNPFLKFDVAYARIANRPDSLQVFYTSDCGITRSYIYKKTGIVLASGGASTVNFIPNPGQWRTDSIQLPAVAGNVQIGFENINGFGNNIYIDNINIYNQTVGMADLNNSVQVSVLPNPAADLVKFTVKGQTSLQSLFVELYNIDGKLVLGLKKLNEGEVVVSMDVLSPGLYIYHITNSDGAVLKAGKIIHL